jgi:hypothetical protein
MAAKARGADLGGTHSEKYHPLVLTLYGGK